MKRGLNKTISDDKRISSKVSSKSSSRSEVASVNDKTGQTKQCSTIFQKAQLPQKRWSF